MAGYLARVSSPREQVLLTDLAIRLAEERQLTPAPLDDSDFRAAHELAVAEIESHRAPSANRGCKAAVQDLSGAVALTRAVVARLADELPEDATSVAPASSSDGSQSHGTGHRRRADRP